MSTLDSGAVARPSGRAPMGPMPETEPSLTVGLLPRVHSPNIALPFCVYLNAE